MGMVIGAGTTYDFTDTVFGKLAWDRYNRIGNVATGTASENVLSAGVGIRF
jgi:opacity protein-like surface antigen